MVELTLLLPERERLPGVPPLLRAWTARGDRLEDAAPGRDSVLRGCFEFIGTGIPVAALTRSLDAQDAASAQWLRADPAWLVADAVTLRMFACGDLQLAPAECDALARALKPLFGDAGFPLEATTPSRWYLRCPPGVPLPAFSPPSAVLGDDVARHLPEGEGERQWRYLLSEAQVILHNHPVNAERTRRGVAPVNSLWFWGAGDLPDWVRSPATQVRSDDDVLRALAAAAGAAGAALGVRFDAMPDEEAGVLLLDLAGRRDIDALQRDWLQPVQDAIAAGKLAALDLRFESGERYRYRHRHRWRLWRRVG